MGQNLRRTEWGNAGRERVEAMVEALAGARNEGETLAEVAHDARNMVTALGLYCDLLEEPGVLAAPFLHYGSELRLVATSSRRLVEKLVALDSRSNSLTALSLDGVLVSAKPPVSAGRDERSRQARRWDLMPAVPIDNLASELMANRNLLAALAGPMIALTVLPEGGARAVRLNGEDLTRVLVNLVKNAAEAMPAGGKIRLALREKTSAAEGIDGLVLSVEDTGTGIPNEWLSEIFAAGFSTQPATSLSSAGWPAAHRGLGLSITRSIIEAAGGSIVARNLVPAGACFEIELPTHR